MHLPVFGVAPDVGAGDSGGLDQVSALNWQMLHMPNLSLRPMMIRSPGLLMVSLFVSIKAGQVGRPHAVGNRNSQ